MTNCSPDRRDRQGLGWWEQHGAASTRRTSRWL